MSWLADRLGVHLNLRPLAKVAGSVAGNAILPGLGGMALGGGLADLLDGLGHHEGFANSAKKGAMTAGLTYGGGKALGALKSAFAPSSSPAAGIGGSGASSAAGGGPAIPYGALGSADTAPGAGGIMGALKSAGSYAAEHPNAIGGGLQGLGAMASAGSENGLRNAQAAQIQQQTRLLQEEEEAKKARAAALEPLMRALMGGPGVPSNPYGAGANPYGAGR